MHLKRTLRKLALASTLVILGASPMLPASALDLGIEGQVFEPIEEDFRLALMRLLARQDWTEHTDALEQSARDYTKNLPDYFLAEAADTKTVWKDVGVVVTEDIELPWVDWETGSVMEPTKRLAVKAGTYLNPIAFIPSSGIERLFVFDATNPAQLKFAKELMKMDIPQLSFMLVAGDLGPLAEEMNRPIYHPSPTMLEKFHITATPSLVGFGRGIHAGHMAITHFKMPATADQVKKAWFGLPYEGYDPENLADYIPKPEVADSGEADNVN